MGTYQPKWSKQNMKLLNYFAEKQEKWLRKRMEVGMPPATREEAEAQIHLDADKPLPRRMQWTTPGVNDLYNYISAFRPDLLSGRFGPGKSGRYRKLWSIQEMFFQARYTVRTVWTTDDLGEAHGILGNLLALIDQWNEQREAAGERPSMLLMKFASHVSAATDCLAQAMNEETPPGVREEESEEP